MKRNLISGIYAITPEIEDTGQLVARVGAAVSGGVRLVQYRNKTGSAQLQREQCSALGEILRGVNGVLIVNDSSQLALTVGADGVHLGKEDESVADARRRLGPDKLIGVSCYNDLARATLSQAAGADYVAFGSFFPSSTKPFAVTAPIDLLGRAKSLLKLPVVAIGGINRVNAMALIEAGADAIAIVSALFCADDVEQEARLFTSLIARQSMHLHN